MPPPTSPAGLPLRRRVPGVLLLLLTIGVVLVTPLAVVGRASLRNADAKLEAATVTREHADRLRTLIRLAPAVSREGSATGALVSASGGDSLLPDDRLVPLGFDLRADLADARAKLDSVIATNGDAGVGIRIAGIRAAVDGGDVTIFSVLSEFEAVAESIALHIREETEALQRTTRGLPDGELVAWAQVATVLTDLQIATAGQFILFVTLHAPFFERSVDDVRALSDSIARVEDLATDLDDRIPADSPTGIRWREWRTDDSTIGLANDYREKVVEMTERGVPRVPALPEPSPTDLASLDDRLATAIDVSSQSVEVTEGIPAVITAAFAELDLAIAEAQTGASQTRTRTLAIITGFAALLGISMLVVIGLVVRPVKRMAEVAESLRGGRLDTRMPEAGPHELRVAAHAMNEAITALATTEAQAVALAEERLDDPILSEPSIGRLGASLQAAVTHLATSLAERDEFQQRLAHEASHDGLTRLANRNSVLSSLRSALARTRRSSGSLALLFIDLDDFKSINDLHGHQAGDTVLSTIATRLSAAIRDGDLAGRLGGDELVVVAEPIAGIDEAVALSDRIRELVSQPIMIGTTTVTPSVSIGIGLAGDGDLSADELIRDADLAVYRAKSRGKGRVEVCDQVLRNEAGERSSLEQAIQDAIVNDELVVHFQPIVDTGTNKVSSLEALVRWDRPGHGLVEAEEFLPSAERSDVAVQLDRWVLDAVADRIALWTNHPILGSLPVSVNISARHLSSGSLADEVEQILFAHEIAPDRLIIEITESMILEDIAGAGREMERLHHAGIRIALDDFGTGHLSLPHLQGLPIDVVKIDRSFVSAVCTPETRSLVRLMINTAHMLGATVTAEGVETSAQARILAAFGSDDLQGYLFTKPLESGDIEALMESGSHPMPRTEYFGPRSSRARQHIATISGVHATSR